MKYIIAFIFTFNLPVHAMEMHLIDVRQGSELSDKVRDFRKISYESADGGIISMAPLYKTSWTDMRVTWMTPLHDSLGLIWGLSTGERGLKYQIEPGITLGFTGFYTLDKNTTLQWRIQGVIGGQLKERSCQADYGDIAGIQQVNCRLAASLLAPEDTLQYLEHRRPLRDNFIMIRYQKRF